MNPSAAENFFPGNTSELGAVRPALRIVGRPQRPEAYSPLPLVPQKESTLTHLPYDGKQSVLVNASLSHDVMTAGIDTANAVRGVIQEHPFGSIAIAVGLGVVNKVLVQPLTHLGQRIMWGIATIGRHRRDEDD